MAESPNQTQILVLSYLKNRHSKMFKFLLFTVAVTQLALARMPSSGPPCGRRGCRMGDGIQWIFCNNEWRKVVSTNYQTF